MELLSDLGDEQLYQMTWVEQVELLVEIIVEREGGTILAAASSGPTWQLRLLFPDRDQLSQTHETCRERGRTFQLRSVYELENERQGRFGLTEEQYTTITTAHEHGYYEVPRDLTADDLAEKMGISHQAVSERLRRGHGNLVENAIMLGKQGNSADEKERTISSG